MHSDRWRRCEELPLIGMVAVMGAFAEFEASIEAALLWLDPSGSAGAEPSLAHAVRYALTPAGGQARPQLTLTIAQALGVTNEALPAAVAIELIHNASLVHDDMPCFDDALMRRGKPSVPQRFGEAMALLVGDALLALAFRESSVLADPLLRRRLAETACHLIGGQAMELSARPALSAYHDRKTACLFALAAEAPARIAGVAPEAFAALGHAIGRSYQLADDLFDQGVAQPGDTKTRGRDAAHRRPNAALALGEAAATRAFGESLATIEACVASLPCDTQEIPRFVQKLIARFERLALPTPSASMHARRQWHVAEDVALGAQ